MANEIKETQGHKKLIQYLEDLKRNKHFIAKINRVRKTLRSAKEEKRDQEYESFMNQLSEKYQEIDRDVVKLNQSKQNEVNRVLSEIAEEYGLDFDMSQTIIMADLLDRKEMQLGETQDMVSITDHYDEYFNEVFPLVPFEMDTQKQLHTKSYPVSLDIHKFASKRDVLDYIDKRWEFIESYLQPYRGDKNVRFRQRKLDRKVTDFLWEHKNISSKELKKLLDTQFPDNGLAYFEIQKIISIEKRRRFRKITVGQ